METKALVFRNWDDMVFENRNKEYGAYVIRKTYSSKVLVGFFGTLCFVALLLFIPRIFAMFGTDVPKVLVNIVDNGTLFLQPPPVFERPPQPQVVTQQTRSTRTNLPPIVTREEVIETPIESTGEPIAEGETGGSVMSTGTGVETGTVAAPVVVEKPEFMLNPEIAPAYEDGMAGMMRFIQRKLRYPASARRMGVTGTVYVSFIVNGDGTVSKVEVIKGFHIDCDKEAARVISIMPGWIGGKHGGMPVAVKMVLPIKFELNN